MAEDRDLEAMLRALREAGCALDDDEVGAYRDYLQLLRHWCTRLSLVASRDHARLAERHVLESLNVAVWTGFAGRGRLADVGAGAGFPGVPLAIRCRELDVVLIESVHRKAQFLSEVRRKLRDHARIEVVTERAEDAVRLPSMASGFDFVTARGLGKLERTARWLAPLVRPGGLVFAFKGTRPEAELEGASAELRKRALVVSDVAPLRWGTGTLVVLQRQATDTED